MQMQATGERIGATFDTNPQANDWIARARIEKNAAAQGKTGTIKTIGQAMQRYAQEISPTKRSGDNVHSG